MSSRVGGPRRALAVNAAKLTALASRTFGRGGGTALPGIVASRLYQEIASDLAKQLPCGSFLVSGTNGKTTTARMLAAILDQNGFQPIRNESGSNLMRGVASSLALQADAWGNVRSKERGLGLFEVDEASLPGVLRSLRPRGLLLIDVFRDQLDRYGEVATVVRLWAEALGRVLPETGLIVNGDDPLLADAARAKPGPVSFFGIESAERSASVPEHASDVKGCPCCGSAIAYSTVFLGHLGHYRCSTCDFSRPRPTLWASRVRLNGVRGSGFVLEDLSGSARVTLPLPGMYNVYNAMAAGASARWFGVPLDRVAAALTTVTPAFGRMERIQIEQRCVYLALAKNPAGFNEILRTALEVEGGLHLLVMLNDNTADGHDVSWIWDSDVELLRGRVASVVFGGIRAADMALRFKYAGAIARHPDPTWTIETDTEKAFLRALDATPPGETLLVIPTYTALLDIRNSLTRLGHVKPYWDE